MSNSERKIFGDKNRSKVFQNIVGFLKGIVADNRINISELDALHAYVSGVSKRLDDPDIHDLDNVTFALAQKCRNGEATSDDLVAVVNNILEYRTVKESSEVEYLEEFLGLCTGVLADMKVTKSEAVQLQKWLENHEELTRQWPTASIAVKLQQYLRDGELTAKESSALRESLYKLIGGCFLDTGTTSIGLPEQVKNQFVTSSSLKGKSYYFLGTFFFGSLAMCHDVTKNYGGRIAHQISRDVDYVVVGSLNSPLWFQTQDGNKLENLINMNPADAPDLIGEDIWFSSLPNSSCNV